MKKRPATKSRPKATRHKNLCFTELLSRDPELSALRTGHAQKPARTRRAAAEWAYDASISDSLFGAALARLPGEGLPPPRWPPGFAALAIDPEYAPALLTVGCYEHRYGHKTEGLSLLLRLTRLSPKTKDWIKILDKAGQALMDSGDAAGTRRLYEAALETSPNEQEFVIGLGWALARAGKKKAALPWLERAAANDPKSYEALNDFGWGLAELGRFDEAQKALEKAVRLAPADYDLPANNLERVRQLQKKSPSRKKARKIQ
jgi:tetratricopeptide (TPR) repeat protein